MRFIFLCILWSIGLKSYAWKADFTVSKDGLGDFRTVQEAIDAVPDFRKQQTIISIKAGVYTERISVSPAKKGLVLIGEDPERTLLTYDHYAQHLNTFNEEIGTSGSASFYVFADDFTAINISFENSAGAVGQAVAIWIGGDRAAFKNCRFLGFQDTLYTYGPGARQYFEDCYIEGTVDFIFGSATAWFEKCLIYCKKKGYITAASTPESSEFGYIFNSCTIEGMAPEGKFYLGRPWRPFAKVAFIHCELSAIIHPTGWDNWSNAENEKTAQFVEYQNTGPGAQPEERAAWSRQLSAEEISNYTLLKVFRGWNPLNAFITNL